MMQNNYPSISFTDASDLLELYKEGVTYSDEFKKRTKGQFLDEKTEERIIMSVHRLMELLESEDLFHSKSYKVFEEKAAKLLHSESLLEKEWRRDEGFWRWLTFVNETIGPSLIDWRYESTETPGNALPEYYGLGAANKGFFAFLWMRADAVWSENDGYSLVSTVSDIDFWWSHVIRVDHGCCRALMRAFVKVVSQYEIPRGKTNDPDSPAGFRDLAREIKRRYPTTAFELMDDHSAKEFLTDLWNDREFWCGKK